MARWISRAACAAVALSLTLAATESSSAGQNNQRPAPDKPTAGATTAPRNATLSGCVVRDAANGGLPTIASNGISYKLTGKPAAEFAQYLGKRVDVTGTLTAGSTGAPRATIGTSKAADASSVPKGLTATAGQSDVTATGVSRDNTVPADPSSTAITPGGTPRQTAPTDAVPLATDRGTTADLTGQMQVKTVRVISPNCL